MTEKTPRVRYVLKKRKGGLCLFGGDRRDTAELHVLARADLGLRPTAQLLASLAQHLDQKGRALEKK